MTEDEDAPIESEQFDMRIHLDTGIVIEFTCEEFTTTRNEFTGQLTGYETKGVTAGSLPRWIDVSRIVAITREVRA